MLRLTLLSTAAFMLLTLPLHAEEAPKGKMRAVDTDGNGVVTLSEAEASVDRQFANLDKDKNGSISKEEFKATNKMAEQNMPKEFAEKHKGAINKMGAMRFAKLDTNKNNELSKDELKSDMKARHEAMDSNKDGNVSKDEVKKFRETMNKKMSEKKPAKE